MTDIYKKFFYHDLCLSESSFLRNTVPLLKLGIHCLWNENSKPPPMFYKYKTINFNNVWLDKNSTTVLIFRCMDKLYYSLSIYLMFGHPCPRDTREASVRRAQFDIQINSNWLQCWPTLWRASSVILCKHKKQCK